MPVTTTIAVKRKEADASTIIYLILACISSKIYTTIRSNIMEKPNLRGTRAMTEVLRLTRIVEKKPRNKNARKSQRRTSAHDPTALHDVVNSQIRDDPSVLQIVTKRMGLQPDLRQCMNCRTFVSFDGMCILVAEKQNLQAETKQQFFNPIYVDLMQIHFVAI